MFAAGEAARAQFVLQDNRALLADIDIVQIATQARDAFGYLAPIVILEPGRCIAADLFECLVLRGHVPLEGERIATNARDLGEHLIRVLVGIVVFQKIENLVHIDDGLAHAGDEQFGEQRDGGARVWRAFTAIEQRYDFARCLERMTAQRHQPPSVAPELHGDHVFRLCARIEVDPPERADQIGAFAKRAWPGLVAGQQFCGGLGNPEVIFEPVLHAVPGAADVDPEHVVGSGGLPALDLVPVDRPGAARSIEHTPEQQGSIGVGGIGFLTHRPIMQHGAAAVIAP